MVHVAEWKKEIVAKLSSQVVDSNVVALADVMGIAAPQMQMMRATLRDRLKIQVIKKTLLKRVIDKLSKEFPKDYTGLGGVLDHIGGQTAIITSSENPFSLYQILKARKANAPAKGGEVLTRDISVEKGPTPFNPGPIISDLQRAGFPASIQKGKVVFTKKQVIVKAGDPISENVARLLTQLEIYPLEVGLMPQVVFEGGEILLPSVLDIDLDAFTGDIQSAVSGAFNLAMTISYATEATIVPLVQKAYRDVISLALSQGMANSDTISPLIGKAHSEMLGLASRLDADGLDDDLKALVKSGASVETPTSLEPVSGEKEEEEDEEEEEVSEDDAVGGLGMLFG